MKIIYFFLSFYLLLSCSKHSNVDKKTQNTNYFYDKAFEYREKGMTDSSFSYFYKAKDIFAQQKDHFGIAKCLTNLAIIQDTKGDYFGSQETGLSALKHFNQNDSLQRNYISINYNTLSLVFSKLQNYHQATEFYKKAIAFADDNNNRVLYKNNLAINYKKQKQYQKAVSIFESLIENHETDSDLYTKSKVIDNLAYTKWLQNNTYNPLPELREALNIRFRENDLWGKNASYAHFSDYYKKTRPDSALFYAREMYKISKKIESPDDQIEALQKLIILDTKNYSTYFNQYQKLSDSLQTARNKAKNQFALIYYDSEKNKVDFLKAQTESTKRQNHIIKQYFGLAILSIALVLGYFLYQRKQKILLQEKLIEVKNTELKYSKKVHDRVANKIYQLMSQVENKKTIDRDALLFGLESAYETCRDISYDNKDFNETQSFTEQLHNMMDSYTSSSVKLISIGNYEKIWEGVNFQTKTEVYLVLQELMTNMKKHSQASIVSLKFSKENSTVNISYTDNGIGIKKLFQKNGLQNMENRINAIDGTIIFDTETNNLLKINISFPV